MPHDNISSNNCVDEKGRLWKLLKIFYWTPNQVAQCKRVMESWGQDQVINTYLENFRRETGGLDFSFPDLFFYLMMPDRIYYNSDETGALVEELERVTLFSIYKREDYFQC